MTTFLCDVNVWLALSLSGHVHHDAARDWLDEVDRPHAVLFCRSTQQALLRLLTNPAVLAPYGNPPLTNDAAWSVYASFTSDDRIMLQPTEPQGLERHWKRLARRGTASSKLWMDAYLAAFALTGGHRMVTTDVAFRQFADLDLHLLRAVARS